MSPGQLENSAESRPTAGDIVVGVTAFVIIGGLAFTAVLGLGNRLFGYRSIPDVTAALLAWMVGWHSTRSIIALRQKRRRESLNAQRDALLRSGRCPMCNYDLTGNVSGTCPECGSPVMAKAEEYAGRAGGLESTKSRYTVADLLFDASAFLIGAAFSFVALSALAERWLGPGAVSSGVAALLIAAWYAARGIMATRRRRRGNFAKAHQHAQPGSEGCRTCDHSLTATTDVGSGWKEPAGARPNQPDGNPDRPGNE